MFKGEDTLWNVSFRGFNEMRTSRWFHCVNYREMFMVYFLDLVMKYENSKNRFAESSLSWKTFLLKLLSYFINSFIINDVWKFNGKWKHKTKSKIKVAFFILKARRRCSVKKMLLNISQNLQENTCARVSSLIKLQGWGLQLYLKRDSGTGVFLWLLLNF